MGVVLITKWPGGLCVHTTEDYGLLTRKVSKRIRFYGCGAHAGHAMEGENDDLVHLEDPSTPTPASSEEQKPRVVPGSVHDAAKDLGVVDDGGPNETTSAPAGSPTAISRPPRSNTEKNTDSALSDLSSSVSEQDGTIQDGASEDEPPGGDKNTSDTPTPTTPEVENLRKELNEKDDKIEILKGKITELERELDNERKKAKAEKQKAKNFKDKLTELRSKYREEVQSRIVLKLEFERKTKALIVTKIKEIDKTIRQQLVLKQSLVQKLRGARPYNINPEGSLGVALIISIHKEKGKDGKDGRVRGCASNDDDLLEKTLQGMGFKVLKQINPIKKRIMHCFKNLDKVLEDDTKMFLGAHGGFEYGEFFCCHEGNRVYLEEVYDEIGKCRKLKLKPKIVIVHACLGKKTEKVSAKSEISKLSDLLVVFSAAPRHVSYGLEAQTTSQLSTPFVTALCDALGKWEEGTDLETIIIDNVHHKFQVEEEGVVTFGGTMYRHCPYILSSLRGRIMKTATNVWVSFFRIHALYDFVHMKSIIVRYYTHEYQ